MTIEEKLVIVLKRLEALREAYARAPMVDDRLRAELDRAIVLVSGGRPLSADDPSYAAFHRVRFAEQENARRAVDAARSSILVANSGETREAADRDHEQATRKLDDLKAPIEPWE